jgi:hypothetical protein
MVDLPNKRSYWFGMLAYYEGENAFLKQIQWILKYYFQNIVIYKSTHDSYIITGVGTYYIDFHNDAQKMLVIISLGRSNVCSLK